MSGCNMDNDIVSRVLKVIGDDIPVLDAPCIQDLFEAVTYDDADASMCRDGVWWAFGKRHDDQSERVDVSREVWEALGRWLYRHTGTSRE